MAGRKSYWGKRIKPRMKEIAGWARDGLTNEQIAQLLGMHVATFLRYKASKDELYEALKVNKQIADLEVENSLYKRALGYTYTEITEESYGTITDKLDDEGKPIIKHDKVHRRTTKKQIVPDVTAQIFWLKNRQPDKWRDRKQNEISGPDGAPININVSKSEIKELMDEIIEEDDC